MKLAPIGDAKVTMDESMMGKTAEGRVSGAADSWPLSAREAATVLGLSERTVRRAIARGELPAALHAGVYRIAPDDLARFREGRRGAAPPANRPSPAPLRRLPFLDHGDAGRSALPRPRSDLIGRERELAAVRSLLLRDEVPLVTLTGPGGVGKTRLAADLGETFPDGVWFVALASLADVALVPAAIAGALGVGETGDRRLPERLAAFLAPRTALLVLDNFEHLSAAAPALTALLAACPRLKVLVTSRVILHITGEHRFPVSPLALPDLGSVRAARGVADAPAVRLFCARARAAHPDFALSDDNAAAVAAICVGLNGLPLAIELAAARSAVLPPRALLARLDQRLDLLTGGPHDAPARLRDMRDTIAWSHDLLSPEEQILFRRLAIFAGGCTLEASQAVGQVGTGPEIDVLAVLSSLIDKSLLHRIAGDDDEPRFGMLETIREFGLERLAASGEEAMVRGAHAAWCVDLAERAAPDWFTSAQKHWGDVLETEHANLRAALAWLTESDGTEDALRLTAALWPFWFLRSHFTEGRRWLERALLRSAGAHTSQRVRLLNGAASIAVWQGDWSQAADWCEEALAVAREVGDAFGAGNALLVLGHAALSAGDDKRANRMHEAALAVMRDLGETVANAPTTASAVLGNLADVALSRDDLTRATRFAEEALALQRERGFSWGAAHSLFTLAAIARRRGETTQATALYRECLGEAWAEHDLRLLVRPLDSLAILAAEGGQSERAAHLFGAAPRLHELLGTRLDPTNQPHHARAVAVTRERLGDPGFEAAWALGEAMPLEQAVDEAALVADLPSPDIVVEPAARFGLTRREREVLRLLSAGLTDREIADALFVSRRTVNAHVASILAKLGVASRRAAATLAREQGWLPASDGQPLAT